MATLIKELYKLLPEGHMERINKETKFIVDKDYKILSPLTKESAQFWGQGTRWCTSAKEKNAFDSYNHKAPLYILIAPNGSKFQLWRYKDSFEVIDEADDEVSEEFIEDHWEYFKHLCDILPFYYVPQEKLTYEKCLKEVKKEGDCLRFVPDKFKIYELCFEAVKNGEWTLKDVPDKLKTYELCMEAVKKQGWNLQHVPEKFKTYELYLVAVKNDFWGIVLECIPEKILTEEMFNVAINNIWGEDEYKKKLIKEKEEFMKKREK